MSIKIYPVHDVAQQCADYEVKINGQVVKADTARVSAVPFNRRWPGHQRQIEQSELVNFVSFACEGETVLEIIPKKKFENVVVRPTSLGLNPEILADGTIKIVLNKPEYFTVEPYGRKKALHIFADPMPQYQVGQDEDVLYFGSGLHEVGMLNLKSNQTVFIDEGAVVFGCIHATDAENIRIIGRGILDNSHNKEEILFDINAEENSMDVGNAKRLHTIQLEYCTNIEIDGITIRDSLVYNVRPIGCKNLTIKNVKIIGCWRFNSDGIDMHNCEHVRISDCFLRTFDDSICVKGFDLYNAEDVEAATREAIYHNGEVYDCFKDVIVNNCTIWNDWGKCLEIGAETKAKEICDIVFKNCNIIHVCHGALTCSNGDYADVHDVTYENIHVEYDNEIPAPRLQAKDAEIYENKDLDYTPHLIAVGIYYYEEYSRGVVQRGINRDITFKNIYLYGRQKPTLCFEGYDAAHLCSNILVEKLYWNGERVTSFDDGQITMNEYCKNIRIL